MLADPSYPLPRIFCRSVTLSVSFVIKNAKSWPFWLSTSVNPRNDSWIWKLDGLPSSFFLTVTVTYLNTLLNWSVFEQSIVVSIITDKNGESAISYTICCFTCLARMLMIPFESNCSGTWWFLLASSVNFPRQDRTWQLNEWIPGNFRVISACRRQWSCRFHDVIEMQCCTLTWKWSDLLCDPGHSANTCGLLQSVFQSGYRHCHSVCYFYFISAVFRNSVAKQKKYYWSIGSRRPPAPGALRQLPHRASRSYATVWQTDGHVQTDTGP